MHIVPIIADGRLIKSHTEYPVTNTQWKRMHMSLSHYLDGLPIDFTNLNMGTMLLQRFAGIYDFYLRERFSGDIMCNNKISYDRDPWNRTFVCFPPEKFFDNSKYVYYTYDCSALNKEVNVIVTTVNKSRVYCVDIVRLK